MNWNEVREMATEASDMSILARSGFSYELSKKVLDIPKDEFKKFCKMI